MNVVLFSEVLKMRKRHYEIWNPKENTIKCITPKQANKILEGRFIYQVSKLKIGDHLWMHTGERIKCVQ
jgi:hypothetical protein